MSKKKKETTLLKIHELVREYRLPREKLFSTVRRVRALDRVSLDIKCGESFGIVGESGCGKSTLARTIMALESPQSGKVIFQGKILHELNAKELRRVRTGLQMIFQDPYSSLDPKQRVEKIIAEPLSLLGDISKKKRVEMVIDSLRNVGLSENDMLKFPHEFSGGQRQRIAIARALITHPALIIADEPVSALDVSVQAQVLNLLMDLRDKYGMAYLFISHDLSIVRHMTAKVAVMYAGKIVEQGSTERLFNNSQHPYTRTLIKAIPLIDPSKKKRKYIINSVTKTQYINTEKMRTSGCVFASQCPIVEEKCRNISPALQNIENFIYQKNQNNKQKVDHEVACYKPDIFQSNRYEY